MVMIEVNIYSNAILCVMEIDWLKFCIKFTLQFSVPLFQLRPKKKACSLLTLSTQIFYACPKVFIAIFGQGLKVKLFSCIH